MIIVHVQVPTGEPKPGLWDGITDVFVSIPDGLCTGFDAALKLWPVGKPARFEFHPSIIVEGYVKAVHEQLAMVV